uniref:Uncharacterized protein n=1 Tax=Nostoc flagelliforme str. Sunitezuoqi TaxID=676037 RepID=E7DPT2_9NOSO|nr:hypothetical protein Nfla_4204 [Nostoc flagelliforme str. Sunitezuoqi]
MQELHLKLTNDADLSDIWLFYMDHFADLPEFTDMGEPAYNEYLDAVLQKTCQQMFDRAIKISDFLLIYIAPYHLFHGAFQIERRIGGCNLFRGYKNWVNCSVGRLSPYRYS